MYNIELNKLIQRSNIYNQCCKDFLYGEDLEIEKILNGLEGKAAKIIDSIIKTGKIPNDISIEQYNLLEFILIQRHRTLSSINALNDFKDITLKTILMPTFIKNGIPEESIKNMSIVNKSAPQLSVCLSIQSLPLVFDLHWKMIKINCDGEFITSDNPVVLYNQFLKSRNLGDNTGLALKGLQLFFPINSKYLLALYDKWAYIYGRKNESVIYIDKIDDVFNINRLQFVSALENVYFKSSDFKVSDYLSRSIPFRRQQPSVRTIREGSKSIDICFSAPKFYSNFRASFISITDNAKKFLAKRDINRMPLSSLHRDDNAVRLHRLFIEESKMATFNIDNFYQNMFRAFKNKIN